TRTKPFGIGASQLIFALGAAPAAGRYQLADVGITVVVRSQDDELRSVGEADLGADDQVDARVVRRFERAHDAGKRTFVGNRQRGVAEFFCALEQLLRARCATLETEIRKAMQFGVFPVPLLSRFRLRNLFAPSPSSLPG